MIEFANIPPQLPRLRAAFSSGAMRNERLPSVGALVRLLEKRFGPIPSIFTSEFWRSRHSLPTATGTPLALWPTCAVSRARPGPAGNREIVVSRAAGAIPRGDRWGVRVDVKGRRLGKQHVSRPRRLKSTTWAQRAGQTTRAFLSYVSERPHGDSRLNDSHFDTAAVRCYPQSEGFLRWISGRDRRAPSDTRRAQGASLASCLASGGL